MFERSRRDFLCQGTLVAALSTGLLRSVGAQTRFVEATTTFGRLRGADVNGIKTFKGIPYGASTAGANRFMPPVDPAEWRGVRDAIEYGASAPQRQPGAAVEVDPLSVSGAGLPPESEDCLVLNVWTPAVGDRANRPVMVWCHGGGFSSGAGSSPVTDGTNLARRGDVVVVSLNHRLNVLGYTYFGELGGAAFEQSGSVGMLDIVHALKWVRANIAEFGGDPGNVTVFGQSGGGRKVSTLLTMPGAKGLFHRAIIESGATIKLVEREQAARVARELVTELGLSSPRMSDLQGLPVERIMNAYFATVRKMNVDQMTMGFVPTVDGVAVPRHPFHPSAADYSAAVPVMLGSTRTEVTNSADEAAFSLSEAAMRARVGELLGEASPRIVDIYRAANPDATPTDIYFLIASDHRYSGPVMKIAERRAALRQGAVYLYYFRWGSPLDGGKYRSPHTVEIPFAFDNVASSPLTRNAPEAQALAAKVSEAWLAFARTGDPNTPKSGLPTWRAFDATDRATMVFDNESSVVNDPIRAQRLAMFDALGLTS